MSDKAIAKRMARFFAKNGLKYEKRYMNINDARINFLRSPEDPLHGYYKQKLSEYLSQIQKNGAIVDDDEDVATNTSSQVIEPPPGIIRNDMEWMARYSLVAEKIMMQSESNKARYRFMGRSNHPDQYDDDAAAAYQQKLTQYQGDSAAPRYLFQPQPIVLPNLLEFRLPKGMNINEFKTMKLTAQFGAWYGNDFWLGFKNRAGFEFTNPTDSRFPRFTRFVLEYSEVMKPPKGLKEKLSKDDAYMAAIHDGFFRLLQCDSLQEIEWRLGGVMSMIDWHASLDKDFPNNHDVPVPGTGTVSSPPEPEPSLVPEDQFLAQHPGWCTIRISVTDIFTRCKLLVIEKTVQSLSESVASLKEKIAEEMRIPPERQMLFGKAGLLEEKNRSLAHYNVGAGDILTLSSCACVRNGEMDKPCLCREMLAKAISELMLSYNSTFN